MDRSFFRFVTIYAFDKQTDRQTDRQTFLNVDVFFALHGMPARTIVMRNSHH